MDMEQSSDQQEVKELSSDQAPCQQSSAGDEEEVASELVRTVVWYPRVCTVYLFILS